MSDNSRDERNSNRELADGLRTTVDVLHSIARNNVLLSEPEIEVLEFAQNVLKTMMEKYIDLAKIDEEANPAPQIQVSKKMPVVIPPGSLVSTVRCKGKHNSKQ